MSGHPHKTNLIHHTLRSMTCYFHHQYVYLCWSMGRQVGMTMTRGQIEMVQSCDEKREWKLKNVRLQSKTNNQSSAFLHKFWQGYSIWAQYFCSCFFVSVFEFGRDSRRYRAIACGWLVFCAIWLLYFTDDRFILSALCVHVLHSSFLPPCCGWAMMSSIINSHIGWPALHSSTYFT